MFRSLTERARRCVLSLSVSWRFPTNQKYKIDDFVIELLFAYPPHESAAVTFIMHIKSFRRDDAADELFVVPTCNGTRPAET